MLDCLIASVAWRLQASILSYDADLDRVARVVDIELDEASLRGSGWEGDLREQRSSWLPHVP